MKYATAVAALGLVLTAAGCAREPEAPLSVPGSGGEYCSKYPTDGRLAFGAGDPTNASSEPVRVVKVELDKPQGMKLIGSRILFLPTQGETTSVGVLSGWPPDLEDDPELQTSFEKATDAPGTTIPASGDVIPSFVVGVKAEPGASSGPIKVTYKEGDDTWTWKGKISFRVAPSGESC